VITKAGGNAFHGTFFEFFRNEALNASDYFLNRAPVLKENQFGFAFGGPIKKDKLLFFSSYQGTRQSNGAASGQSRVACSASLNEPPLTDDRSQPALGRLFGGMAGALGGEAVKADGSNLNPAALNLLNFKLSDGSFLIPTPQTIDPTMPFALQGLSVLSRPCHFSEDQFLANVDYLTTSNGRFAVRYLFAPQNETVTFTGNGANPAGNVPGFPSPSDADFQVLSIARIDRFRNGWLNETQFGYVRTKTSTQAEAPFKWSDVGVAEGEMNDNNELPSLRIRGSISLASGFPRMITQNSFVFSDSLSFIHGAHTGRLGGSVTRVQDNVDLVGLASFADFLSWPDFLLGLSAQGNGSAFSNVYSSIDAFGLTTREYRAWEGVAFAQDNYRVTGSLTLNLGVRYERLGEFGDNLGRNASFDFSKADPNPPPNGSLAGYLVASNYSGALPQGVTRVDNTYGNYGVGQDTIAPRIGFSQQLLPHLIPLVLRAGYGIYYSRPTGQAFYQNIFGAPFSEFRIHSGSSNANATFQSPFLQPFPTPESFPEFLPYSPASSATVYAVSPNFRPAIIHQYSLNVQVEPQNAWLLEVGYVGTRGLHLVRQRSFNQAQFASVSNPVRGVTTNTIANIPTRLPILGIPSDSGIEMESEGSSWYNGLEVSLTKLLGHGFQFLASYTFSKTLDTDGADINSTSSGNQVTLGDQNSPNQRWGRASFDRTHRFVISGTWALPSAGNEIQRAILGGWILASTVTVQSGNALTIAYTNPQNVFGISEDRAEVTSRCTTSQFVTRGPITSKLGNYFDTSCFTTPPVIGADGTGTGFGNSRTGAATGPGQANVDVAFSKILKCKRPVDGSSLEFRTEFYNALNHPQFANPDNDFASPTFGVIRSTSVSSRVIQLALKFAF
jgi:TonB dependent receptor